MRRIALFSNRQQHRMAPRAGTGVQVETQDDLRLTQMLFDDGVQRAVRPGRLLPAIKQAICCLILARFHHPF